MEQEQTQYKIQWEMIDPLIRLGQLEYDSTGALKNDSLPDEAWQGAPVSVVTTDPWDQYSALKSWADRGVNGIRNVKLFSAAETEWTEVEQ